jgi:hypothetical protein
VTISLPVDMYSTDQLSAVMLELRDYCNVLRDTSARKKITHAAEEVPHVSALLLGVLHGAGIRAGNYDDAEGLLKELESLRSKAVVAHVTLAALPTRTLKRQLTVWFRAEIHPSAFLTFVMRSDIGGGIIVQMGSRLYDFSFREVLLNNKARIGEIFSSVR